MSRSRLCNKRLLGGNISFRKRGTAARQNRPYHQSGALHNTLQASGYDAMGGKPRSQVRQPVICDCIRAICGHSR